MMAPTPKIHSLDAARDKAREYALKSKYGLTIVQYDEMLTQQNGSCAGCRRPPKSGGRRLHVDHNHKTGKVRGLVCWHCNSAIKKLRDSSRTAFNLALMLQAAGD